MSGRGGGGAVGGTIGAAGEYLGDAWDRLAGDRELRVLFAAFAMHALVGDAYEQAVPLLFDAIGASAGLLGLALGLAAVVEVVLSPVVGVLADAVDRLALVAAGLGLSAVVLASFLLATTPLVAVAVVVGFAVAGQLVNYSATPAVNDALQSGFEGIGWGVRDVGLYLGGAAGVALGGAVLSAVGDVRFVFLALVPVQVATLAALWRALDREGGTGELSLVRLRAAVGDLDVAARLRSVSAPWRLLRLLIAQGLVGLGTGMALFLLPLYGVERGLAPEAYLFLFAGSMVVAAPLSLLGGALADAVEPKWLYVGNAAVEAVILLAFGLADSTALFVAGLGLYVLQTGFEPGVLAYVFGVFEDGESGRVWGVAGMVAKAVGVAAPVVGGVLFDAAAALPFLVGAAVTAGGALVALTLPRRAAVAT